MSKLPPLHQAIVDGDVDQIKSLLTSKWYRKAADVNGFDNDCGLTPLHRAIECRNGKILRLLLKQRPAPDLNVQFAGTTPLDLAIKMGYREGMVRLRELDAKTARDLRQEQKNVVAESSVKAPQAPLKWRLGS